MLSIIVYYLFGKIWRCQEFSVTLHTNTRHMKSAYKYELADAAGVNYRTFQRWLSSNKNKLMELGVSPRGQLLPPKAVAWICQQYGIDL